jgi:phosphomannomutase/phosphoglucomutase
MTKSSANPLQANPLQKNALLTTALAWGCGLAASAYLALIVAPTRSDIGIHHFSETILQQQAALLDSGLKHQADQISYLATRRDILGAVTTGDDSSRELLETQLQFSVPSSASVVIVPLDKLGIAGLDQHNSKLRNNIEFDLVRAASQGETVAGEIYQADGAWLVSQVTAIKNGTEIAGALLVRYRVDLIQGWMQSADKAGQMTLSLAAAGSEPVIAIQTGTAGDPARKVSRDIAIKNWKLEFTPSPDNVEQMTQPTLWYWLAGLLGPIAVTAWAFVGQGQLQRAASRDAKLLVDYAEQLVQQPKKAQPPALALAPLNAVRDSLQPLLQKLAKAAPAAPAATTSAGAKPRGGSESARKAAADKLDALDEVLDLDNVLDLTNVDIPELNDSLFREYDIRGIAERDLGDAVVYQLGLAIGSQAAQQGQDTVVVGYDGRHTSPAITEALIRGLTASGRDVINIGLVPTPLLYFATHELATQSGVMVTGSHNPPDYNGLKIVIAGETLHGDSILQLKQRIQTQNFTHGQGSVSEQDISAQYVATIVGDVAVAQPLKVVIDCGNGAGGELAPRVLTELGCEVIPLFCDIDGSFPNHHPDPSVAANLDDLIDAVRREDADIGIALDGDADRIGIVSKKGNIIPPDRLLMLFAQDVVSRNPGADVIFDVKCTRHLNSLISSYGGRPILWKSGHSNIKAKMQETGALLGGEFSGHIFFKERWFGFDDGIYSAARLIEILSTTDPDLENLLAQFPSSIATPEIHVAVAEDRKFLVMENLARSLHFEEAKITQLDGIRADFPDGWGLVRASNTTPVLTLRFEAETAQAMQRIQQQFKQQMSSAESSLRFPF